MCLFYLDWGNLANSYFYQTDYFILVVESFLHWALEKKLIFYNYSCINNIKYELKKYIEENNNEMWKLKHST